MAHSYVTVDAHYLECFQNFHGRLRCYRPLKLHFCIIYTVYYNGSVIVILVDGDMGSWP